jgi:Fe2+ transport system protein FeoA
MTPLNERIRLTGTPIGRLARLTEFGDEIDVLQREQLLAYGLSANQAVTVLQQNPMTVVLCDHMELALEHAVAHHIWVEEEKREKQV